MHISISYPPLESEKGIPLLSQNRQFQWFSTPTYIYPVIPAYAATLLASRGHKVTWDDAIAEQKTYEKWINDINQIHPEIIVFESKTPVIKRHWKIINELKKMPWSPIIVLLGDHVTAMPEESLLNSNVDYVITGGDFDFVLADLVDAISSKNEIPQGVWYRENSEIKNTGKANLSHDLNTLPFIDRELTKWHLYAKENGNFKYRPGTYVMAGRDCWWGKCSFCSWTTLCPGDSFKTVSVERHLDEIENLVNKYKIKEIFDDSGCFPKGEWLEAFCNGLIKRGLHKKVVMGCNMRMGALTDQQWKLLKKANFRFILIGLESVNQSTLNRLTKGINTKMIEKTIRSCKNAGLEPHITTMVGYPWENRDEAYNTIAFAKRMFNEGLVDSLQATIVVPYPGTPLFYQSRENGWLLTEDWDRYDMRESVWKSEVGIDEVKAFTQELYKAALSPKFIIKKVFSIRSIDDFKFLIRAGIKVIGHLMDFKHSKK